MFVGEAPGSTEDQEGKPFVGRAGKLLDKLLGEIGLDRGEVFIANVLKCRPPGNRDPQPEEIDACEPYLMRQVELISRLVMCTLGNFSTKLLTGRQDGITSVRGGSAEARDRRPELDDLPDLPPGRGPARPRKLAGLREDFAGMPELLAAGAPAGRGGGARGASLREPVAAARLGLLG